MERVLQLIESAHAAACVIDCNHRVMFWNRPAQKLLGYTLDDVLGRPCFEVFGGIDETGCSVCRRDCDHISDGPVTAIRHHSRNAGDRERRSCNLAESACARRAVVGWHELSLLVYLMCEADRPVDIESSLHKIVGQIHAQSDDTREPGRSACDSVTLSTREMQVLRLLALGISTSALAAKLFISETTVRNHIQHIHSKLGVHSRLEAVTLALRLGLL